jgi:acetylornithine/succinyldiaminopimelate/putrescine aminotransferase
MREQATALLHVSNYFHIPQQIHLAKLLCDHSFADRVFFSNSGAEANETAIKLCRKWAKEHGSSDRGDIISMRGGFHGRTLATVTATAQDKYHHGFEPLPAGFKYVAFNDLTALERAIDSRTAGVLVEPIQGEGGCVVPTDGFFPALRRLCDKYGILLIADEVQSGVGRTGKWWAIENWGVEPDIVCFAKGIASGIPLGGILARASVMDWPVGAHGNTFGGNPIACSAAVATLSLVGDGMMQNALEMGEFAMDALTEIQTRHKSIGQVRGKGLMLGVELVVDRQNKRPARKLRERIIQKAFSQGLLLLGCGENSIRVAPPLNIERNLLDEGLQIMQAAIAEAEAQGID